MKIAVCAAEGVPFVKVGGLGDVIGALPQKFAEAGHEVLLFLPWYAAIDREKYAAQPLPGASDLSFVFGYKGPVSYGLREYRPADRPDLRVIFIENSFYFEREGVYSRRHNKPYDDEGDMWVFYQRAIVEALVFLDFSPQVIHVHDFHTALIPALIRFHHTDFFHRSRTLLTLHNFLFQGVFPKTVFSLCDISEKKFFPMSDFEYFGKTNFVKTGIIFADAVNTVSPHYAMELLHNPAYSYGLFDLLMAHQKKFTGILNGADYRYWNPETDEYVQVKYGPGSLGLKRKNRSVLMEKTGLQAGDNTMVLGIVARMTKQKGFQLLLDALDDMMKRDIGLVILASGESILEREWEKKAAVYSDRIHYEKSYSEDLSHKIQAGCDLFLMPSLFEPCGLSQMYAMKYGTPPLAFATGGLADTIIFSGPDKTGFLFYSYRVGDFLRTLDEAIRQFRTPDWERIQRNGMAQSFSWDRSSADYLAIFQGISNS